jgi:hypothetical protein
VQFYKALDQRQAEAGSFVLAGVPAVQLDKWLKDPLLFGKWDADPRIGNTYFQAAAFARSAAVYQASRNFHFSAVRGKFYSVSQKVINYLPDFTLIGGNLREIFRQCASKSYPVLPGPFLYH